MFSLTKHVNDLRVQSSVSGTSAGHCSRKADMPCTLKYATLDCRGKLCLVTEHDQYVSKAPRLIMFGAATKYVLKFFCY